MEGTENLTTFDSQIKSNIKKLKDQKDEMTMIIEQQKLEKIELERELEKIVYKLKTLDKSISQRSLALENYENKLNDAENKYDKIVKRSEQLLMLVKHDLLELENIMDKRTGTSNNTSLDHQLEEFCKEDC